MRILVVSAMFPPNVLGGAEVSAFNLSTWLRKQGHEVGVLMAAKSRDEEKFGEEVDGLKVWSRCMPRPYPIFLQNNGGVAKKPLWHLQDHFDPRNARIAAEVLDAFRPDFCNIHYLQGLGYNILPEIGRRDIPVMFVMPDMGLSCFRMTMYRNGRNCQGQCRPCRVSSEVKRRYIRSVRRIGFCSPSRANLRQNALFQPLEDYPTAHILNANKYPAPTVSRASSDEIRFIYAGRMQLSKGIAVLLEAAEALRDRHRFSFNLVGGGADEPVLRKRFGRHDWISFTGHVPLQSAIDHIASSDMLCAPSVWLENSPGVVIQALGMGVPVMGSDIGGIPELVEHGKTGVLVPPGDLAAWQHALGAVLESPDQLAGYRQAALTQIGKFDQDYLGAQYLKFIDRIRHFAGLTAHVTAH